MKPKVFNKKLSLNKKTIADLKNGEMNNVHGGINDTVAISCTCVITGGCCPTQITCGPTGNINCRCGAELKQSLIPIKPSEALEELHFQRHGKPIPDFKDQNGIFSNYSP